MGTIQKTIRVQWRDDSRRAASWRCVLATLAVVPLSFFGMLYVAMFGYRDFNAAGAAVYFLLCLVSALPLAFANSFLMAPWIATMAGGRRSTVGSHLIVAAVWAGLVFCGYLAFWCLATFQFPAELGWLLSLLVMFWYLTIFLGPAAIAGSFVYSLKYNSVRPNPTACA